MPDSSIGSETGYSSRGFPWFSSALQDIGQVRNLFHDRLLSRPSSFIPLHCPIIRRHLTYAVVQESLNKQ